MIGKWELGEKDLMQSLEILPDQAYTINYLAYTWIEKEKNTRKALTMLKKANTELQDFDLHVLKLHMDFLDSFLILNL